MAKVSDGSLGLLTRFKKTLSLVLLAQSVASCSSAVTFLSGRNGPDSKAYPPDASQTISSGPGASTNDEKELPTIEVAGANLTSECTDLDRAGQTLDSKVVRCEIKTDSDAESTLKVDSFTLKSSKNDQSIPASGVSGTRGTDPDTWRVSKKIGIDLEFDIATADVQTMKRAPAYLTMENVVLNGLPVAEKAQFKPIVREFTLADPRCGVGEVSKDFNTEFSQTGITGDGTDFAGNFNPDAKTILNSATICRVEFLNNIELNFTGIPISSYRFEITLGGIDNLLMTNIENVENIFGFPPVFTIGKIRNLISSARIDELNANRWMKYGADLMLFKSQLGGEKQWCAFGVQNCYSASVDQRNLKINLMNFPSPYLVKLARSFLGVDNEGAPMVIQLQNPSQDTPPNSISMGGTRTLTIRVHYIPFI